MEVWIVDDVPETRILFEVQLAALEPGQWTIKGFGLAAQALSALQTNRPTCVVVDRLLPAENSDHLVTVFRERGIPVLVWSGEEKWVLQKRSDFSAWWTRFRTLVIPMS